MPTRASVGSVPNLRAERGFVGLASSVKHDITVEGVVLSSVGNLNGWE